DRTPPHDTAAAYRQARSGVALFDIEHRGKVELTGPEAGRFLHNLCSNDVLNLPEGAGCETFLLNIKARVVAYAFVGRGALPGGGGQLWLDVDPGFAEKVCQHLDRHLISEQVVIADRTRDFAQLHLAGPRAPDVLEALLGAEVS